MITRILSLALAASIVAIVALTFRLAASDRERETARILLVAERATSDQLRKIVDRAEANRENEAVAAARDLMAVQAQCQTQIKTAQATARAIAEITDAKCLDTKTTSGAARGLIGAERLRDAAGQTAPAKR